VAERRIVGRVAIISVDGHVRASRSQYRDYLEKKHLAAYDEQVKAEEEAGTPDAGNLHPDLAPEVQWDSDLRTANLEEIGVVGEVLFPNGVPFQLNPLDDHPQFPSPDLADAGRQAYNRWLVEFCAQSPGRRKGQVLTSFMDVDQAVKDVHWAKEMGLGGIMLPQLTRESRLFLDPELDPIWAACQEAGLPISAHGGASIPQYGEGGFGALLTSMAEHGFFSNRSLWMLVSGGVFDRFSDLRVCYTETQADLLLAALRHLDAVENPKGDWMAFAKTLDKTDTTERGPSEYLGRNIFVGVSPFSPTQISMDDLLGKGEGKPIPGASIGADAAMFGVDYPQFESIFDNCMDEVATLVTAPGATDVDATKILLQNAAAVYGFDLEALAPHIERVGFDLSQVRADAAGSKRKTPTTTKAPFMLSAAARATSSGKIPTTI
jgi:predicted TIM-barrel fold metal-dependent hydrolase